MNFRKGLYTISHFYLHIFEHSGVGRYSLVDVGEVVEYEIDLEVGDELHEALTRPDHVGGPHLHLEVVLLRLRRSAHL